MLPEYTILPKRNGQSDGSRKKWTTKRFFSNYYEIQINQKKSKLYQYDFKLPEEIPQDSDLYEKGLRSVKKFLKDEFGFVAHKGQQFWGLKSCKVPTVHRAKFSFSEKEFDFEVVIKQTKELDLSELDVPETRMKYLQILNIDLKNTLKSCNMTELGKIGQFYPRDQHLERHQELDDLGLTILRGFKFTLVPLNVGISLQIDVCSRVLQKKNLLEIFNGHPKEMNIADWTGQTVITKYGTYRTFSIVEIDYSLTPLSTFHNEKKGATMTYKDYFKDAYGLTISNNKQPLLRVVGRYNQVHREDKNGRKVIEKIPEYIYLIPEFVSPTGMTDEQRAQHSTMKAIAPYTKLSPNERVRNCEKIIEDYNKSKGLIEIKHSMKIEGALLDLPIIRYQGTVRPDEKGAIKNRGVLKEPHKFKDWLFVYSTGRDARRDDEEADDAVNLLKKAGKTYGIEFVEPGFITVGGNTSDWMADIKKDVDKNGAPEIIVFYLNNREEKMYGDLKRFVTN